LSELENRQEKGKMKNLIIAGAFIGVLFAADYLQLHGYAKWIGLAYVIIGGTYFIRYIIKAVRRG
jgi:6,7-dimethyl-8-ribityllumazine synthase